MINRRELFLGAGVLTAASMIPAVGFTNKTSAEEIKTYLHSLKARRGIYDYQVICDQRNNTPADYDAGVLNIDVYIKPVRAVNIDLSGDETHNLMAVIEKKYG